jgi:hypothetical protein
MSPESLPGLQSLLPQHGKRWIRARLLKLNRTVHVYLTLLGLAMMLFFAVTGFMLNHDDWFDRGKPVTKTLTGQLPGNLLQPVDKLAVEEKLRGDFRITGTVVEFTTDRDEIRVTWKSPGRRADASIDPATGAVELTIESRGLIGRLTDLHKGADSGAAWKLVIDAVAILIAIGAITGLLMWSHLPKRRNLGIVAMLLGAGGSLVVYWLLVP